MDRLILDLHSRIGQLEIKLREFEKINAGGSMGELKATMVDLIEEDLSLLRRCYETINE